VDWDISELLEDDDVPAEARELAARISHLTRVGVVLVTARLTEDGGLEPGLSGQISAQRYLGGEPGEDLAAGLVLAGADDVVEDLLLGRRAVTDVPGHVRSRDAGRLRGRRLGKRLRRPGTCPDDARAGRPPPRTPRLTRRRPPASVPADARSPPPATEDTGWPHRPLG
jgi:hypothetical protein